MLLEGVQMDMAPACHLALVGSSANLLVLAQAIESFY